MRIWLSIAVIFCFVPCAAADDAHRESARKIMETARSIGANTVAVLPVMAETVVTANDATRQTSASLKVLMHLEQMENYLAEFSFGDIRVITSSSLHEALSNGELISNNEEFTPEKIQAALKRHSQGVDAVVVGLLSSTSTEQVWDFSALSEFTPRSTETAWRLIDLRDQTLAGASTVRGVRSLSDAVYEGLSGEFFRWEGRSLRVLSAHSPKGRQQIALNPQEDVSKYRTKEYDARLNPILNPNCPYKVSFKVNGALRAVQLPVFSPKFTTAGDDRPRGFVIPDTEATALLAVEPGEDLVIRVRNTTPMRARLAVFIDGVNILGKSRELPNNECQSWVIAPNKPYEFLGWYTKEWADGDGKPEPFEITSWEDSAAGQLGLKSNAPASRSITLVFFSEGPVDRKLLLLDPSDRRYWKQDFWFKNPHSMLTVREWMFQRPSGNVGAVAPAWGMGGKAAISQRLNIVQAGEPGTILAAMTVRYGTESETNAYEQRLRTDDDHFQGLAVVNTSGLE